MRSLGLGVLLTGVLLGTTFCGGGGGGETAPGTVGSTVIGMVVNASNQPVPVIPVVVEGHDPVLTDTSGRFVVEGVSLPYTLILITELGEKARVYAGLTRLDPSFRLGAGVDLWSASLAGTTTGGIGFPLPPNYTTVFSFGTAASGTTGTGNANSTTGNWSLASLGWQGPPSTTAQFFALQVHTNGAGLIDDFTGLATLDAPIANGESRSGFVFALESVDTALCAGTVNRPPAYTYNAKFVFLTHASGNVVALPTDTTQLDAFSLATVDAPDVSTTLLFSLAAPGGGVVVVARRDVQVPAVGLSINIPSDTTQLSPTSGATGVGHSTPFAVSPDAGRVYTFTWSPQAGGPQVLLLTAEPSVTIPDLAEYGLAVPPGAPYEWSCQAQGPDLTVDDLAAGQEAGSLVFANGYVYATPAWTFTTGQ